MNDPPLTKRLGITGGGDLQALNSGLTALQQSIKINRELDSCETAQKSVKGLLSEG